MNLVFHTATLVHATRTFSLSLSHAFITIIIRIDNYWFTPYSTHRAQGISNKSLRNHFCFSLSLSLHSRLYWRFVTILTDRHTHTFTIRNNNINNATSFGRGRPRCRYRTKRYGKNQTTKRNKKYVWRSKTKHQQQHKKRKGKYVCWSWLVPGAGA